MVICLKSKTGHFENTMRLKIKNSPTKNPHKILVEFTADTLQSRRHWNGIFKMLKEEDQEDFTQKVVIDKLKRGSLFQNKR